MLSALLEGDASARSRLLPLIYEDLRALAAKQLKQERPGHTLQPTALVHEAWLRLIECERMDWQGRTHFFAMAATMLRRVLVDHARARGAKKRGGNAARISLSDVETELPEDQLDLLALDEALEKLAEKSQRQAQVVELRYFAGLSIEEAAFALGVSADTVKSDWRFARSWLNLELTRNRAQE
jgi:RNA polymerase sigma factor (TIGR02999 family)